MFSGQMIESFLIIVVITAEIVVHALVLARKEKAADRSTADPSVRTAA
jgi:hypothetical protein